MGRIFLTLILGICFSVVPAANAGSPNKINYETLRMLTANSAMVSFEEAKGVYAGTCVAVIEGEEFSQGCTLVMTKFHNSKKGYLVAEELDGLLYPDEIERIAYSDSIPDMTEDPLTGTELPNTPWVVTRVPEGLVLNMDYDVDAKFACLFDRKLK